ncbi:major histocompatibility complex class I-related gene protein-like [Anabas testudineus]|uniref:Ig-like domain-containing protein n=1 Tax=Anabas testudineus TaxID=64144 RepID=A0A3Q1J9D5_ANATE|nr:major histocompatibility complex class I-related gene protein-like [Anabas testudineus]
MKTLKTLLLLFQVVSAVKHSMRFYFTLCSGLPNLPEFTIVADFEEVRMGYYDSSMKAPEARHDWLRKLMEEDPEHWERIVLDSMRYQQLLQGETEGFKQNSSQTAGVHITQQVLGCEWDEESDRVDGWKQYGYNGEDFITFNLQTETWIAANPRAEATKQEWDRNGANNGFWKSFLTNVCPTWMKMYLKYADMFLQRTAPPSVSLLQKTPSSPVSCHATGFYPDRASMFWRKDGEEIHEDVDHGEILPNHDGTFQMSVDLNISSVKPENWSMYDCVFQISGVKKDVITKLDKAEIRTNWGKTGRTVERNVSHTIISVVVALVSLGVVIAVVGFTVYKKKKAKNPPPDSDKSFELSEKLNPEP